MNLHTILPSGVVLVAMLSLTACGKDSADNDDALVVADAAGETLDATGANKLVQAVELPDMTGDDATLSAVIGASEIPYPVYPNGSKYRVGGENGLKIVVFQTDDAFEKVDEYYREVSGHVGMPRLIAMNDYVRYSKNDDDQDPWATYRPGIVIHQFNDDGERNAVGAKGSARTNIIMSF